jgi:hypothetical protein
MGSFAKGSKNLMTQTSTQKFVEEVVAKVMQVDKAAELFQTMAIKYGKFEFGGEKFEE